MTARPTLHRSLQALPGSDGRGVVRLEDRFTTDPDDLWSALTDPERLSRWLGEVSGDLREGGEFDAHYLASGWEGRCRIEVCDPPHRLLLSTRSPDEPAGGEMELWLSPEAGGSTRLVVEDRGMPLDMIAAYGAGNQIHLEDLAAYLAGGERCEPRARWQELLPGYAELAPGVDASSPAPSAGSSGPDDSEE